MQERWLLTPHVFFPDKCYGSTAASKSVGGGSTPSSGPILFYDDNIDLNTLRIKSMKICPKCNTSHEKKGEFCSRSCANSRTFSKEAIEKKSIASKKQWKNSKGKMLLATLLASQNIVKKNLEDKEEREKAFYQRNIAKGWDKLGYDTKRRCVLFEQQNKCNKCGINEWLGKPISLELEHIDGNRDNNERSNLECLCPNCHSQTPTWRGRHRQQKLDITDKEIYDLYLQVGSIPKTVKALNLRISGTSRKRISDAVLRHKESIGECAER